MTFKFTSVAALLLLCATAQAQDALRASLAGEQSAESRKRERLARGEAGYNLDLDPVKLRLSSSISGEYNDNVNLDSTNRMDDFILRPTTSINAYWQITELNALDLTFDLGYEYYFNGSRDSRPVVTGNQNSGLYFDIYVGDFLISLHDKFALSQDSSSEATGSGIANIYRFENDAGVTVTWDLQNTILDFNYDHQDYVPLDSIYDYLKHSSELASIRLSEILNPAFTVGVVVGAGSTSYSDSRLSNNHHISIGPFVSYHPNEDFEVRANFGYTEYWYDASGTITNDSSQTGFYADLALTQRFSPRTSHTLLISQSLSSDINSVPLEMLTVRYSPDLRIIENWTLQPYVVFESGNESLDTTPEEFTRWGAGMIATRQITEKLFGSLGYHWLTKSSNIAGYEYDQNRLVLNLSYQF